MSRPGRYRQELRERAVRMVFEHQGEHPSQWSAITSIATKFGASSEALRKWVRRAEVDGDFRPGLTTDERERLKTLEAGEQGGRTTRRWLTIMDRRHPRAAWRRRSASR